MNSSIVLLLLPFFPLYQSYLHLPRCRTCQVNLLNNTMNIIINNNNNNAIKKNIIKLLAFYKFKINYSNPQGIATK